eukprot:jgi/Orpsp1_1/1176243/evm.model.c7180000056931.1
MFKMKMIKSAKLNIGIKKKLELLDYFDKYGIDKYSNNKLITSSKLDNDSINLLANTNDGVDTREIELDVDVPIIDNVVNNIKYTKDGTYTFSIDDWNELYGLSGSLNQYGNDFCSMNSFNFTVETGAEPPSYESLFSGDIDENTLGVKHGKVGIFLKNNVPIPVAVRNGEAQYYTGYAPGCFIVLPDVDLINKVIYNKSFTINTPETIIGDILNVSNNGSISEDDVVKAPEWINNLNNPKNRKFYVKLGKNITSYSSAKTKHLGPGNAYEIVRQLYPENVQEKSQYISTALLNRQQTKVNTEYFSYNYFYKKVVPVSDQHPNGYEYVATKFDSKYPCNLIENPSCPFKPTLLVDVISGPYPMVTDIKERDPEGFDTLLTIGVNKIKPFTFDVEGLRYNRSVDSSIKIEPDRINLIYDEDSEVITQRRYRIMNLSIDDSRFKNKAVIHYSYSRGDIIERAALPFEDKNRYICYLETSTTVNNGQNFDIWLSVIDPIDRTIVIDVYKFSQSNDIPPDESHKLFGNIPNTNLFAWNEDDPYNPNN